MELRIVKFKINQHIFHSTIYSKLYNLDLKFKHIFKSKLNSTIYSKLTTLILNLNLKLKFIFKLKVNLEYWYLILKSKSNSDFTLKINTKDCKSKGWKSGRLTIDTKEENLMQKYKRPGYCPHRHDAGNHATSTTDPPAFLAGLHNQDSLLIIRVPNSSQCWLGTCPMAPTQGMMP